MSRSRHGVAGDAGDEEMAIVMTARASKHALQPLPACGERSPRSCTASEGGSPRTALLETPPHPNPLPASGERGRTAVAETPLDILPSGNEVYSSFCTSSSAL